MLVEENVSALKHETPGGSSNGWTGCGALIINADDWGRDRETTDQILDCVLCGAVSSTSAMVFMPDSERAAEIARAEKIDAGIHLNFTTPFGARGLAPALQRHHERVAGFLTRNRFARTFFHPGLARSFEYVVRAQTEEYRRLYDSEPRRVDGHHHMHLCSNVLFSKLLPAGTIARRNFSFQAGEKSPLNRLLRKASDAMLARRHRMTDYFFSLPPLEPIARLERIVGLAKHSIVEVETHPVNADEYRFLIEGAMQVLVKDVPVASGYRLGN